MEPGEKVRKHGKAKWWVGREVRRGAWLAGERDSGGVLSRRALGRKNYFLVVGRM